MKRRDFFKATLMGGAMAALPSARALAEIGGASAPARDISAVKLSGAPTTVPAKAVKDLAGRLHGQLLTAGDKGYEEARRIWNHMIDRRPALIARCSGAADVATAVAFARERELLLAVRGGGHSFPGYSVCDGGLMIDLSRLRGVRVDPAAGTAHAEPGAWIGDLDWESQRYGLATPMGEISNTGIAGLTLGGGYGYLGRMHGLACDNLIAADVITADGKFRRASAEEDPDLLWALRGGGGNFGVVTSFEYRLHRVGPKVLAGNLVYPASQLRRVVEFYAKFTARAPRETYCDLYLQKGGDGTVQPFLSVYYGGDTQQGEKALKPLLDIAKPITNTIGLHDYVDVQRKFDGPALSPDSNYVKSGFIRELTPALVEILVNDMHPDGVFGVDFFHCGGAIADVEPTATAVAHRQELFQIGVLGSWSNQADNDRNRARIREEWAKIRPYTSGFYVNLEDADQKAINDNYGPNRPRLEALKKKYDPGNLFRLNANVRPA